MSLIEKANQVYRENFPPETWFERAIFISWFCAKPTCKFCYMYTIKDKITDPRKARRRLSSIFAESIIIKHCNWKIGFISAGISSWATRELEELLSGIYQITGEKQWLNLGVLRERQIKALLPYIEGITGTVECVNEELRNDIVPDKPLEDIDKMFKIADKYNIKKSITIIIGLGETIEDYPKLKELIEKWDVDRINFYRLVPHEDAPFEKGPTTEYYTGWIARTRIDFPKLEIIAGSWPNKTKEIPLLLKSGANAITKLPAIKLFGKQPAINIKKGAEAQGRKFLSNLTELPEIDIDKELKELDFTEERKKRIKKKFKKYMRRMTKNFKPLTR